MCYQQKITQRRAVLMVKVVGFMVVVVKVALMLGSYFSRPHSPGTQVASEASRPNETKASGEAGQSGATRTEAQIYNEVVAKNDLRTIFNAETAYRVQHNNYGSYDQLVYDRLLTLPKHGRDGYSYELENSSQSFRAIARCSPVTSGCTS